MQTTTRFLSLVSTAALISALVSTAALAGQALPSAEASVAMSNKLSDQQGSATAQLKEQKEILKAIKAEAKVQKANLKAEKDALKLQKVKEDITKICSKPEMSRFSVCATRTSN